MMSAQSSLPATPSSTTDFDVQDLNGITLHGTTHAVENIDYFNAVAVTVQHNRSVLHRLIVDRTHHLFFGYDLEAFLAEGSSRVHVHFAHLSTLDSIEGIPLFLYKPAAMAVPHDQDVSIGSTLETPIGLEQADNKFFHDQLTFALRHR
jgi:hypothetical protein